jgi:hypothetical protein
MDERNPFADDLCEYDHDYTASCLRLFSRLTSALSELTGNFVYPFLGVHIMYGCTATWRIPYVDFLHHVYVYVWI